MSDVLSNSEHNSTSTGVQPFTTSYQHKSHKHLHGTTASEPEICSSCGVNPSISCNEEAIDSQIGTLESTDGHYTTSAFASKGKKR